jgi:hypothetical protein
MLPFLDQALKLKLGVANLTKNEAAIRVLAERRLLTRRNYAKA